MQRMSKWIAMRWVISTSAYVVVRVIHSRGKQATLRYWSHFIILSRSFENFSHISLLSTFQEELRQAAHQQRERISGYRWLGYLSLVSGWYERSRSVEKLFRRRRRRRRRQRLVKKRISRVLGERVKRITTVMLALAVVVEGQRKIRGERGKENDR